MGPERFGVGLVCLSRHTPLFMKGSGMCARLVIEVTNGTRNWDWGVAWNWLAEISAAAGSPWETRVALPRFKIDCAEVQRFQFLIF